MENMAVEKFVTESKWSRHIFVKCDCWSHGIELTKFKDEGDDDPAVIYMSLWYHGRRGTSLIERLKAAWKVLTALGGPYYFDEIVLTREAAEHLKQYLEEALAEGNA